MKTIIILATFARLLCIPLASDAQFDPKLEVVAAIQSPDPSGIAVTKDGRLFLGFPRHADNHTQFSLAEWKAGKLIPYPNRAMTYPSNKPFSEWLVSPHGMTLDEQGNMWLIDDGKRSGIDSIPAGAAKVVGFDLKTNKVIASVVISKPVLHDDSHLNDLRIDLTHGAKGTAYVTNSSFGRSPSLVVVDLASGKARELFVKHLSTSPDPGFMAFLEGKPHIYAPKHATFPTGGADGIALSTDKKRLYWSVLSGRQLHSLATDSLANFDLPEAELAKAIRFEGQNPSCDGMSEDHAGNLYFGSYEQLALVQRQPDGQFRRLVHDERLGWPDGLFFQNGYLYVTLGQWNRMASLNGGKELRKPPYLVARVKVQ